MRKKRFHSFSHFAADYCIYFAGTFGCTWVSIIPSHHLPELLKIEDATLDFCGVQMRVWNQRVTIGATS